ncbi:beta-galactosidase-1-like protein 2 [Rhopilema esculentum]|uniref:beta-galactosidase-1-like protein 2 n=1 Tax=Rhopilema esculentum TaxID=499914 RepID=UPI0031DF908A
MIEGTKQAFSRLSSIQVMFLLLIAVCFMYLLMAGKHVENVSVGTSAVKQIGLSTKGKNFTIEGKHFQIMSGAMHYFRIPKDYWDDRLIKLKAMGLNTVETYIPWNLHEPEPGVFDFEGDLSIRDFVLLAQTFGIYVIIRPGPYICAEWDLGGLPSWLLRDPKMRLRSSYPPFLKAVDRYFDKLFPILAKLQFSKGGPVIAFQVENEYGSYGSDLAYMRHLVKGYRKRGIEELLFVSDNDSGLGKAHIKGTLQTINFQTNAASMIKKLEKYQPNMPVFVTEFWSGWFDHWGEKHHTVKIERIEKALRTILASGASFNFYMFHGGTNFGFMNGANSKSGSQVYLPTISSYDYNAPVSETSDLTKKFYALKQIILKHATEGSMPSKLETMPETLGRVNYQPINFDQYMTLKDFSNQVKRIKSNDVMPMEMLPIKDDCGQAYGYTLYATTIADDSRVVTIHDAVDFVTVIVNNVIVKKFDKIHLKHAVKLPELKKGEKNKLEILVENCGRINYDHALDSQRKGIRGHVDIDGKRHKNWVIYPLEFKKELMLNLRDSKFWEKEIPKAVNTPALYKGSLWVQRSPHDCLMHIVGWERGAVFVNGRNLGRYDRRGPQRTLYVPRSFLKQGNNEVIFFESGRPATTKTIDFVSDLLWNSNVDFHI